MDLITTGLGPREKYQRMLPETVAVLGCRFYTINTSESNLQRKYNHVFILGKDLCIVEQRECRDVKHP